METSVTISTKPFTCKLRWLSEATQKENQLFELGYVYIYCIWTCIQQLYCKYILLLTSYILLPSYYPHPSFILSISIFLSSDRNSSKKKLYKSFILCTSDRLTNKELCSVEIIYLENTFFLYICINTWKFHHTSLFHLQYFVPTVIC